MMSAAQEREKLQVAFVPGNRREWARKDPRNEGGHAAAVLAVVIAEALLQFALFDGDHDGAAKQGKSRESIEDYHAGAHAPGQHFAKMSQVNGMADAGADTAACQPLLKALGMQFGVAAQLRAGEALPAPAIQIKPASEKAGRGN